MMEHVYLLKVVINANVHLDGKEKTVLIKLILVMVRVSYFIDESYWSHISDGVNPCQNSGVCMLTNDKMDYRCECPSSQYSGRHCELFKEKPFDIYISGES